jgi:predicted nucleotidyltransferase
MPDKTLPISDHDRGAIGVLVEDFVSKFGNDVLQLTLFGSKTRGEDSPESDIDVLVITRYEEWTLKHAILTRGAQLSLENDVLFNLFVISQDRWDWMKRSGYPLYRTIVEEGVDLPFISVST